MADSLFGVVIVDIWYPEDNLEAKFGIFEKHRSKHLCPNLVRYHSILYVVCCLFVCVYIRAPDQRPKTPATALIQCPYRLSTSENTIVILTYNNKSA